MSTRDEIVEALKAGKKSTAELAEATGKTETQIDSLLELLESKGVIVKNGGGKWKLPEATAQEEGDAETDRCEEVLSLIKEKGPQRSAEIQEALGLDKRAARNLLMRMQHAELLEVQGLAKASRWHLSTGGKRAATRAAKAPPKRRAITKPEAAEPQVTMTVRPHAAVIDLRTQLLERKRDLTFAAEIAAARIEEVDRALAACGT